MSDRPLDPLGLFGPSLTSAQPRPPPAVPFADDVFRLPTADEAFPEPRSITARAPLLGYFDQGFRTGFGEGISENSKKWLRDVGLLGPIDKAQQTLIQQFNENVLLRTVEEGYNIMRGIQGGVYGASQVLHSGLGVPRDLTPAAAWEAFPAERFTGLPVHIPLTPGTRALPFGRPREALDLDVAAELGIVDRPQAAARESLAPSTRALEEGEMARNIGRDRIERPLEPPPAAEAAPPPNDIHTLARQIDPETLDRFEELKGRKQELTEWLDNLKAEDPRVAATQQEIDTILSRVNNVESRLTNRQSSRLDALRDQLDELHGIDTTEQAWVRQYRQRLDEEMRDLSPRVSDAYREANRLMEENRPREGETPIGQTVGEATRDNVVPINEASVIQRPTPALSSTLPAYLREALDRHWETGQRLGIIDDVERLSAEQKTASQIVAELGNRLDRVGERSDKIDLVRAVRNRLGIPSLDEPAAFATWLNEYHKRTPATAAAPQRIASLAQRNQSIAVDTANRLIAAGRPAEEARAAGAIIAAHYEARAARFGGAIGSARELYDIEAPRIVGAQGPGRGRTIIREARNTIQLMRSADASTFMHETAHDWLLQMLRDAEHEAAPPDLIADLQTVRDWLGTEGELTRAQHERFARGFERYLLEGQAPSPKLARVFEKFKNWLIDIYQTVSRLRSPITDEIRGVYDRLLATPSREAVIAPERPGARTWAEDAQAAARETPAAEAAAKADSIAEMRERVAQQLRDEINERRRNARRGDTGARVPEEGERQPGGQRTGETVNEADARRDTGGDTTTSESQPPTQANERLEATDRRLVDKAGNIRLDNLMVGDDVADAIIQASGEKSGFIESRRGRLSDAEVLSLAESLGTNPNLLDRWAIAEAWTAEQIIYARNLLVQSATKVRDLARAVETAGTEQALIDYALARERHVMIQERVAAVTAESGRAFRAGFRALKEVKGDTTVAQVNSLLQSSIGKTAGQLRSEAKLIAEAPSAEAASAAVNRAANRTGIWGRMFGEAYTNILVSGPFTHIVNMSTNLGVGILNLAETGIAAGVGGIARALGRESGVRLSEVAQRASGMLEGSVDGIKAAGQILWDESKIPGRSRPDIGPVEAIPSKTVVIAGVPVRIGGAQVRLPGRALAAEDAIFNQIAWQQELNVLAQRAALEEGLTGDALAARINWYKSNPTEAMIAAAEKQGLYQTFQSELGAAGKSIIAFRNAHPALTLILPFIRTPINLFKYAAERTPLGLASREIQANLSGRNGAYAQDTQVARMATGSMIMMGTGYLAYQGLISGGGPRDSNEQAALRRTGWQPYAVRVGDTWISYRRFDPFSTVIGAAADMADLAKYYSTGTDAVGHDLDVERFWQQAITSAWRNVADKLALRGVTSIVQAATDPTRYGQTFLQGMAGSFIPGIVSQTARLEDEYDREARSVGEAVMSRIPWKREDLFPRRDLWGQPITNTEWGPAQITQFNADPVNHKMLELGIIKAKPDRRIKGVELTPRQYDDLVRISGEQAKQMLDGLVQQPSFHSMPRGVQIEVINKMIETAHAMGRAAVMQSSMQSDNDIISKAMQLKTQFLETGQRPH